jgi:hypothetical protein
LKISDFSDWNIQDTDNVISIKGNRINWHRADRTRVRYVGKKLRVRGDFSHSFIVCFQDGEVEDELNRGFIRLWEIRSNWENRTWIYARKIGDGWRIFFEQLDEMSKIFEYVGVQVFPFGTQFEVKVSRIGEFFMLRVIDEYGSILEDSKEIAGVKKDYEYLWLASTIKSRRNNHNWSTGYIENFTI